MVHAGKWIAKHKKLILLAAVLLLIPSGLGYISTRVNYDLLSYLPSSLDTVKGQNIMVDDFGMGAFSMIVVEDMPLKDVAAMKEELEQVDHVKGVLWYDSVMDLSVPVEMLPETVRDAFFRGDATMMIALFDDSTSSDASMKAVEDLRKIVRKNCFVSGMTSVILDVRDLAMREMPVYVVIAAGLSLVVLMLAMESSLVPVLFLLSIGFAVVYNLGTNIFMGQISYVTQALAAVLQLGVTMDYSIFLLHSYQRFKKENEGDNDTAMACAIAATFKSVVGSSVTTIAGFVALCFMTFTLGLDMGIVMAKGVVIGVIVCVTVLPSMVLLSDKAIEKTTHRSILPEFEKTSRFITKHYLFGLVLFAVLLYPAVYGNNHVNVYYNMDATLPKDLPSQEANAKLEDDFDMNTVHMVMLKKGMSSRDKIAMSEEIKALDGVQWALGESTLIGPAFPESMIPEALRDKLSSDEYEMLFVCSEYHVATPEINRQIDKLKEIVERYSPSSLVIGEGPLTEDLIAVTDTDFKNVSAVSILAILVIIMVVFRSLSLPFILVAVIETAIFINMAVAYYQGVTLPFVAGIIIGTVQLGSTVDYAILMTSRYQAERAAGRPKKEAVSIAHSSNMKSIVTSGLAFFAATFGVGLYSEVDMISAICTLLARGALVSMAMVLLVLPAMFMIFDPVICHTSMGFLPQKGKRSRQKTTDHSVQSI